LNVRVGGAPEVHDCTRATIVTDGRVLPTGEQVAAKLGVEIRHVSADGAASSGERLAARAPAVYAGSAVRIVELSTPLDEYPRVRGGYQMSW
jgi:hypothetical protein